MISLGIDTSNYTTSVALFDSVNNTIISKKKLLPVKKGEKGLRQSDAVFHHTVQLPQLIEELFSEYKGNIDCIGVSSRPCDIEGSYMPCFLTGISVAKSIGAVYKIPLFEFSHQQGHISAVLQSTGNTVLFDREFIAFHVSGGTTEAVTVTPDKDTIIKTHLVFSSSDLKAGQAIDRVALSLGFDFPGGKELDLLSRQSTREFKIKPSVKNNTFSLSGVENKCYKMLENGEKPEDVAKYCIDCISVNLENAADAVLKEYGNLPLVFSGGVMSNSLIRERFTKKYGAIFTTPEFSSDNALGIAVLANIKGNQYV